MIVKIICECTDIFRRLGERRKKGCFLHLNSVVLGRGVVFYPEGQTINALGRKK